MSNTLNNLGKDIAQGFGIGLGFTAGQILGEAIKDVANSDKVKEIKSKLSNGGDGKDDN